MIEAILTDLGNTVCFFDRRKSTRAFSQLLDCPEEETDKVINGESGLQLLREFETGSIVPRQYSLEIQKRLGKVLDASTFWHIHNDIFEPNAELIALYCQLQRAYPSLKLFALTNTDVKRLKFMIQLSLLQFDGVVASCYEGILKPDPKIFQAALDKTEALPSECLFVDDVLEYCNAAFIFGFNVFHYAGEEKTARLREFFQSLNARKG